MTAEPRNPATARVLAKNTMYNLGTQVLLVLLSFLSFPILVRKVSTEGFGLLSLIWVLIGYFSILDLGVSRAITKFISEFLTRDEHEPIFGFTWTSLSLSVIFGCTVGIAILAAREFVVVELFHVAGALASEASESLVIAAFGIPVMLAQGILRGVQTAYQRFDLVNGLQGGTGAIQWIGSVVIVLNGGGVREVVLLTVLSRVLALGVSFAVLPRLMPGVFTSVRLWNKSFAWKLLSFGGWVSLTQVISPLFTYIDRLMLASFLALSAVAYYTVPQESVTRLLILPLSMTSALYPILSGWASGTVDARRSSAMYTRAVKYVTILMFPLVTLLFLFSHEILALWMGNDFSDHGAISLQILLVGLLFNAVAQISITALHANGRPDLPAKFNLLELPLMIGLNLLLIPVLGIVGASIAWTMRVSLDAILLARASRPYAGSERFFPRAKHAARVPIMAVAAICLIAALITSSEHEAIRICAACGFAGAYGYGIWKYGFDATDRGFLLELRVRFLE